MYHHLKLRLSIEFESSPAALRAPPPGRKGDCVRPLSRLGDKVTPLSRAGGKVPARSRAGDRVTPLSKAAWVPPAGDKVPPLLSKAGDRVPPPLSRVGERVPPPFSRAGDRVPLLSRAGGRVWPRSEGVELRLGSSHRD